MDIATVGGLLLAIGLEIPKSGPLDLEALLRADGVA